MSRFDDSGIQVSRNHVKQMLRLRGYRKRKLLKMNYLKRNSVMNSLKK
jgi:hypothetical protein